MHLLTQKECFRYVPQDSWVPRLCDDFSLADNPITLVNPGEKFLLVDPSDPGLFVLLSEAYAPTIIEKKYLLSIFDRKELFTFCLTHGIAL